MYQRVGHAVLPCLHMARLGLTRPTTQTQSRLVHNRPTQPLIRAERRTPMARIVLCMSSVPGRLHHRPSSQPSGKAFGEMLATGAVIVGRRTFDLWGTNTPSRRLTCEVLSHRRCHVAPAR
jgi:hypothetical protein